MGSNILFLKKPPQKCDKILDFCIFIRIFEFCLVLPQQIITEIVITEKSN